MSEWRSPESPTKCPRRKTSSGSNVGSNGSAFGVPNNATLTVLTILEEANAQAVQGVLYNGNTTLRNQAATVFNGINAAGGL